MPIRSTIINDIIYTEISGEIDYNTVVQQIDFISSLEGKIDNRYELFDHTNITKISIPLDEIREITKYAKKKEDVFQASYVAIYVPNDFTFDILGMFEIWYQLRKRLINVSIFRNKEEAIQFLTDKKREHGQQLY